MMIMNSMATAAVFAGTFTFGSVFIIPANGARPCYDNCDTVSNLLAIAFVCFSSTLFLTISLQIFLRDQEADASLGIIWEVLLLVPSVPLVGGLVLLGVILHLSDQNTAGIISVVLVAVFGLVLQVVIILYFRRRPE